MLFMKNGFARKELKDKSLRNNVTLFTYRTFNFTKGV